MKRRRGRTKRREGRMKRTGVFATKKEIKSLMNPAPYIVIGGVPPESVQQQCHRYALEHGLPEIKGYYGCDLETGEFLRY